MKLYIREIFLIFILINLSAYAQDNKIPLFSIDTSGRVEYILWQANITNTSINKIKSNNGFSIIIPCINNIQIPSNLKTEDGMRIQGLRVLDTLNNGDTLLNTIYPKPVFHVSDGNDDGFLMNDTLIDFGNVWLDSISSKKIILRNAGNSKLTFPSGFYYDIQDRKLIPSDSKSKIKILRKDSILNEEIKWFMTSNCWNDDIDEINAELFKDSLSVNLAPGDTISFWVNAAPKIVGLKEDNISFQYKDGFDSIFTTLPLKAISNWILFLDVPNSRSRPSTPNNIFEFTDTIRISNNKGNRTRISSFRIALCYNPRNMLITDFVLDSSIIPKGWTYIVSKLEETEKYGKIFIEARSDTNTVLKENTNDPNKLVYFTAGSDTETIFGILKGIQLLGTSDTTKIFIDTNFSKINLSNDFLLDRDSSLSILHIPLIEVANGHKISDSLIFHQTILLNEEIPLAIIKNVYPNPSHDNNIIQIVLESIKDNVNIKLSLFSSITGFRIKEINKLVLVKGINASTFNIIDLNNGAYYLLLETENSVDLWLVNVVK